MKSISRLLLISLLLLTGCRQYKKIMYGESSESSSPPTAGGPPPSNNPLPPTQVETLTLTIDIQNFSGTVFSETDPTITCGPDASKCEFKVVKGTSVKLKTRPKDSSVVFAFWGDHYADTSPEKTISMNADQKIVARFLKNNPFIRVNLVGTGQGLVYTNTPHIFCGVYSQENLSGVDCSYSWSSSRSIYLIVIPDISSKFIGMKNPMTGESMSNSITVSYPLEVEVQFERYLNTLTINQIGSNTFDYGWIVYSDANVFRRSECDFENCTEYFDSADKTVTLTAYARVIDKPFVRWEGDCQGTSNICTLRLDGNKRVSAYYR